MCLMFNWDFKHNIIVIMMIIKLNIYNVAIILSIIGSVLYPLCIIIVLVIIYTTVWL